MPNKERSTSQVREKAKIGILMLDTKFPRIRGDVGNSATWDFPVVYKVIGGASAKKVVEQDPLALAPLFVDAARQLEAEGCAGITTTCGFLTLMQDQLADAVSVPVAASSLMQIPLLQAMLPTGKQVGVITINSASLTAAHLAAAGVHDSAQVPIVGTEQGREMTHQILNDAPTLDVEACRQDMLAAARTLLGNAESIGAIVLECTNMAPYAADIAAETGLPVYSIYSFIKWFHAGLTPKVFE